MRYSPAVLQDLIRQVLRNAASESLVSIDIGSGTGELLNVLRQQSSRISVVAIDISLPMLQQIIIDSRHGKTARAVASGEATPFKPESFDAAFCVCAMHLMNQHLAIREIGRILRKDGLAAVLVHEPEDLKREIFHQYFPAFARFEADRHSSINQIAAIAENYGLTLLNKYRRETAVKFLTPDEVIAFVAGRPFFGLRQLSDETFAEGLRKFAEAIHASFKGGMPVVSPSAITMGLFKKT